MVRVVAVAWLAVAGLCARAGGGSSPSSKADLEKMIKAAYVDNGRVARRVTRVLGSDVEYLEAGAGRPVVLFHGAAFSAETWQIVGVLDALAKESFRAIALNLPGYGASSKTIGAPGGKAGFVASVADALGLGDEILVVCASMGGTYAYAFAQASHRRVVGFVTVAGAFPATGLHDLPATLAIYGEDDPRLKKDRVPFERLKNSQLVVFDKAPHPCYLRDLNAARQFTDLVVNFALGAHPPRGTPRENPALTVHAAWNP